MCGVVWSVSFDLSYSFLFPRAPVKTAPVKAAITKPLAKSVSKQKAKA